MKLEMAPARRRSLTGAADQHFLLRQGGRSSCDKTYLSEVLSNLNHSAKLIIVAVSVHACLCGAINADHLCPPALGYYAMMQSIPLFCTMDGARLVNRRSRDPMPRFERYLVSCS